MSSSCPRTIPRYTQDFPELQGGIEVVPVLIGAFGIPQIIKVLGQRFGIEKPMDLKRILPEFRIVARNLHHILRSSSIGVFIGSIPGAMVANGDISEFFTRPWCIGLLAIIGLTIASQIPIIRRIRQRLWNSLMGGTQPK